MNGCERAGELRNWTQLFISRKKSDAMFSRSFRTMCAFLNSEQSSKMTICGYGEYLGLVLTGARMVAPEENQEVSSPARVLSKAGVSGFTHADGTACS